MVSLLLIAGAGLGVPAQAEDTGAISGVFTDAAGAPLASVSVAALSASFGQNGYGVTDAEGHYVISGLRPGSYRVQFTIGFNMFQFARGKASYGAADLITVTAGATTTVDDRRLPTGTIEGSFRDRNGRFMDGFLVDFWPIGGGSGAYQSIPLSGGRFAATVFAGRFKISFRTGGFTSGPFIQYAGGTDIFDDAAVFEVGDGATVTVNETKLPTGTMHGRFTDAAGNGLPNIDVSIWRPDLGRGPTARTDANGNYVFPYMRASSNWKVLFSSYQLGLQQYAFGKVREAEADLITITEDQAIQVSDSRLPTGSMKVIAKDAASGVPVETFQAYTEANGFSSTTNGDLVIEGVPIGTHEVTVNAYGYEPASGTVTITAGNRAEVTIAMPVRTRIDTTVVDSQTGVPVAGICLVAVKPHELHLPEGCADGQISSATGRVTVETREAGWFQLLALPVPWQPTGYGAQWVGPDRGTGVQLGAQLIKVESGKASPGPVIKIDRAGVVTGTVTSSGGAPVNFGGVGIGPWPELSGLGAVPADEQGRYTIGFLGPYQWPLRFSGSSDGVQHSGQIGNRLAAQTVSVQSGQTTVYDFQFKKPVQVTTTPNAGTIECRVRAFNVISGDLMAEAQPPDCSQPVTLPFVAPQLVKFQVTFFANGEETQRWYDLRLVL
ncbi:MAG TPA: carboxypeptidase-like regulatory domain-containing protein [Candidatus Limnocylindrales bacterium]|nr:carboxypeptidase-like regulatory domain-containing protein [Candidatus Limnocylindrales bacterium]